MKQLIQNFKTGELYVDDVPMPRVEKGMVLVENRFSLISSGTEKTTVKTAKANIFQKALQRPDLVAQVIANFKKEGFKATFQKVQTKLDSLKALGYSTSGTVITSLETTSSRFVPGDRVACAGQDYASHAEVVSIPQNLIVKIPDNVSFEAAAFTTLGAIAMQGVRQADPKLGEKICVIGLGLLGQLTAQLLKANGCDVLGIDVSERLVAIAAEISADIALNRNDNNLISACEDFTNGHGFDSVIITAATTSNDPVKLSTELCRKKGRIVVVGAVKMDIPRDPFFYRKELELRISCSYGPGRYDVNYEERGIDYPIAYVRWTEQRNMSAFLSMISKGFLKMQPLITHVFDIANAEDAYKIILGEKNEPHIGILIKYNTDDKKFLTLKQVGTLRENEINTGFIGAGSFAQSYLIPHVKSLGASLDTVITTTGISSKNAGTKFGFNYCSTNIEDILSKGSINAVFIATPHAAHAAQAVECLKANKNVFVEKPLALSREELDLVIQQHSTTEHILLVGFNRRFAPICELFKKEFENCGEPIIVNIRVNAGFIPKDHWTQLKEVGGGRIIGEMCHFIDLMQYFTGAEPIKAYADCIVTQNSKLSEEDNIAVVIRFSDGSIGNLLYAANGDSSLQKENIEIFGGGKVAIITDFKHGTLHSGGKAKRFNNSGKGHYQEIDSFLTAIKKGTPSPISFRSICLTTISTFAIIESLKTGKAQDIYV